MPEKVLTPECQGVAKYLLQRVSEMPTEEMPGSDPHLSTSLGGGFSHREPTFRKTELLESKVCSRDTSTCTGKEGKL